MNNIILTGFMGTGKSSAGKRLASVLNYRFRDVDAMIVEHEGRSINEIFATNGEKYFRQLESSMLANILREDKQVVSTGGGAVIADENRKLMRYSGLVVNLMATPDAIAERLAEENERPLLRHGKDLEKISTLLNSRESFYADADIRIDTTGKNVEDVVREVVLFLERGM